MASLAGVDSDGALSSDLQVGTGLRVEVLRLDPDLPLPAYARPGDAGADLCARNDVTLAPGGGRALSPQA